MRSSIVMAVLALYSASKEAVSSATSSGAVVVLFPTSFGRRLYSPAANHFFSAVAGSVFQQRMQMLDILLAESSFSVVDDPVDTAEVVGSLKDVIYADRSFTGTDGVGFKQETGLIMCEPIAFHVV